MSPGRKPDPTRKKRGTGHRPPPGEAKPATDVIPYEDDFDLDVPTAFLPPDDLPDEARPIWALAVGEVIPLGLKPGDLEAIRMMVIAAFRARQAATEIDKYGVLVTGALGAPMANPMLKVERDSTATYIRIAESFGLTIAARLRLGLMQMSGRSLLEDMNDDLNS